ncbi:MAG TPA: hypothetical protein VGF90_08050 [Verrucomicrobiae bacterium]
MLLAESFWHGAENLAAHPMYASRTRKSQAKSRSFASSFRDCFHRARAALRAIFERFSGGSFDNRANVAARVCWRNSTGAARAKKSLLTT